MRKSYFFLLSWGGGKKCCWRDHNTTPTPLCRGGTDYFHKKHHFILGVLLAARCVFLQDAPGGAARGVCSDM